MKPSGYQYDMHQDGTTVYVVYAASAQEARRRIIEASYDGPMAIHLTPYMGQWYRDCCPVRKMGTGNVVTEERRL
jgi:hypothetical protein